MSKTDCYIPLPEAQAYSTHINWGSFGFPATFDESQIGVYVERIEKIARWGGLGDIAIYGYRGENTDSSPMVVGMSGVNTAMAGRSKRARKTDPHIEVEHFHPRRFVMIDSYAPSASIGIDMFEIEDSIREDGRRWSKGLMDPHARAHYLNQALSENLLQAIKQYQFSPPRKLMSMVCATAVSMDVMVASWAAYQLSAPEYLAIPLAVQPLVNILLAGFARQQFGVKMSEREWSCFTGIHFDRWLGAYALTKTTKFVKVIKAGKSD